MTDIVLNGVATGFVIAVTFSFFGYILGSIFENFKLVTN